MKRWFLASAIAIASFTATTEDAHAQLHWDVGAEAGVAKRFRSAGDNAGFGPDFELHAHVALAPLVRVGVYVSHDLSPQGVAPAREITSVGARLKLTPPWPGGDVRTWVYLGVGYANAYAASYAQPYFAPNNAAPMSASVPGAAGSYVEAPFGIGLAYRLRGPAEICAEFGGKVGFGFGGSLYDASGRASYTVDGLQVVQDGGNDSFALGLTIGLNFEL